MNVSLFHVVCLVAIGLLSVALVVLVVCLYRMRNRSRLAVSKAEGSREDFFSVVRQEFRTPLAVISGLAKDLRNSKEDSRVETVLVADLIDKEVSKLLHHVDVIINNQSKVSDKPDEDVETAMRITVNVDGKTMSAADAKFVGRLTNIVYSLMGRSPVDVETVAKHLNMSTTQLRRKLVQITGQTPASYILQIRLSNAQRLLDKNPQMSISDVAYRCGFSDNAHFSHAFQKVFGLSPTQWVRRAKDTSV